MAEEPTLDTLFKKPEATPPVVAKEVIDMAAKKKVAKKATADAGSIKDQILATFKKDTDKELTVQNIIERIQVKQPKVIVNSVRATVTSAVKTGLLIVARREGRELILKLNPKPPEKPSRKTGSQVRVKTGTAVKASKASKNDLLILREATVTLKKLEALILRNQAVLESIERFKKAL